MFWKVGWKYWETQLGRDFVGYNDCIKPKKVDTFKSEAENDMLLMEQILHQLTGSLSHYVQGFIHPRWLFGISSIKSM